MKNDLLLKIVIGLAVVSIDGDYLNVMITAKEIEKLALNFPKEQRAKLAAHLLDSLSPILMDEDDGVAEALRRDAEMRANPSIGISLEELDQRIRQRRPAI